MENRRIADNVDHTFDPGTARYGNFMNYYSFNPAKDRMRFLPNFMKFMDEPITCSKIICMDVGCNTGELTQELNKYMKKVVGEKAKCHILGVDMDEVLIQRAEEKNQNDLLTFKRVDVLEENFKTVYKTFLKRHEKQRFDVVFCFSITMWIHLNHGDDGLNQFITSLCDTSNLIVVEPQPWRCYTRAVRRMKRNNVEPFTHFHELKIRKDVEDYIDNFVTKECNFTKVLQSSSTKWGRQIKVFKRNN